MISRIFISTVAALAAGAGLVSSQSISSTCETALAGIAASPEATCLDPSALVSLAVAGNSSIITPIDTWLKGLCALGPCSNSSLSAIVANFTNGCTSDLSTLGITSSASNLTSTVEAVYPLIRQIICLKDTSANELCITETLTTVQSIVGTLSFSNIPNIITGLSSTTSLPSNVTCTNCMKQTYNLVNQESPTQASAVASSLQSQCGSNFTDGSSPSGISELASNTSTSSSGSSSGSSSKSTSNAALGRPSLMGGGLAVSTLVAIFTGFVILA